MLIITWDEHGGFFDHVPPPRAAPIPNIVGKAHGFQFNQYGPRVPAVVISPWCAQNMIEHRQFEHSNIPATIEQLFGLGPLTNRDAGVIGLQTLATLSAPRSISTTIPDAVAADVEPDGPLPGTPAGSSSTVERLRRSGRSRSSCRSATAQSDRALRLHRRRRSPRPRCRRQRRCWISTRSVAGVGAGGGNQSAYRGGSRRMPRTSRLPRFRAEKTVRGSRAVLPRHHANRRERSGAGASAESRHTKAACFADRRNRGSASGCHSPSDRKAIVSLAAAGGSAPGRVLKR